MENIRCILCGKANTKLVLVKKGREILHCKNCGLTFLDTKITNLGVYQDDYFKVKKGRGEIGYRDYLADKIIFDSYFKKKLEEIKPFKNSGKMLDIGCAFGFFLNLARNKGWQTYGVEPSKKAAGFAKRKYGLKIFSGPIESAEFRDGFFDVVTLFQTIEHLSDPAKTLKRINRWLKKDGLVIIATPNEEGYMSKLMGVRWFEYKPDEHSFYFSPTTLERLLRKKGFKPLSLRRDFFNLSIVYLLERIAYYLGVESGRRWVDKLAKLRFLSKPFIPFYLGGIICVARKT